MIMDRFQTAEAQDLPVLTRFMLQHTTIAGAKGVVSQLREGLHFVTLSDPRLQVRALRRAALCSCVVTSSTGVHICCAWIGFAPLTGHKVTLALIQVLLPPPFALSPPQLPDRKGKGKALGPGDNPEYELLDAIRQGMQLNTVAADSLIKEIRGTTGGREGACVHAVLLRWSMEVSAVHVMEAVRQTSAHCSFPGWFTTRCAPCLFQSQARTGPWTSGCSCCCTPWAPSGASWQKPSCARSCQRGMQTQHG